MLKIMQGNKFFTVFILTAITIMITIAFVFWGIGPRDNPTVTFLAQIDDEKITMDQYYRAYDNEYKRLRDENTSPEDIEKMNLPERILNSLVNRRVLLVAARKAGLEVTDEELQQVIVNTSYFQRDGVFSKSVYERALSLNRIAPQTYEENVRRDILISKMSRLIGETAELTPDEMKIIESMDENNREQLRSVFLSSKTNQVIQAYIESVKRQIDVQINRDLIS